ncbi:MAG: hypothetical protein NVS1B12_16050 [Acidimicrobiales bacterium]
MSRSPDSPPALAGKLVRLEPRDRRHVDVLAAAAHRVISDPGLQAAMIAAGRRRLTELGLVPSTERLRIAIARILAEAGITAPTKVVLPRHLSNA